jgi:hypothetical protein
MFLKIHCGNNESFYKNIKVEEIIFFYLLKQAARTVGPLKQSK